MERVILAVGYQKALIRSRFGNCAFGLQLVYSEESTPLGTGGALRQAAELVRTDNMLVLNGDSYTDANLWEFAASYCESHADMSVVVVPPDDRNDSGCVVLDNNDRVAVFAEKQLCFGSRYVNAGIYIISKRIVIDIPTGEQISLEEQVLPSWLRDGKYIKGFVHRGRCIDIGTPPRYESAQRTFASAGGARRNPDR